MRDGFPKPVVVLLTLLFLLGLAVTLPWFFYNAWYGAVHGMGIVAAGGLDILAAMRISALLSVWMTLTSALLWFHHKQAASYTTALELLFGVCFGFFLFLLLLTGAGAVFGS
ncbi:MAG TPA: hypothetical protein VK902_07450 [Rubrobacter sp.]|nr:hypothetical protein [Rubrobacter sp.]